MGRFQGRQSTMTWRRCCNKKLLGEKLHTPDISTANERWQMTNVRMNNEQPSQLSTRRRYEEAGEDERNAKTERKTWDESGFSGGGGVGRGGGAWGAGV